MLYGSVARGHEDGGSDLDFLVALSDDESTLTTGLASRLARVASRDVDVVRLDRIEKSAPLLLARAKRSYRRQSIHTWLKSYGLTFGESSTLH